MSPLISFLWLGCDVDSSSDRVPWTINKVSGGVGYVLLVYILLIWIERGLE
jgi:hypothetical protein